MFTTMHDQTDVRLLTPDQVSDLLSIPIGTLRQWRYEGKGPEYVKVGRAVRYPQDKLDRYLETHTVKPTR